MRVAHLPHSKLSVAFRELPVAGAELADVVMTENTHTHTHSLMPYLDASYLQYYRMIVSFLPSISVPVIHLDFYCSAKKRKKFSNWKQVILYRLVDFDVI